MSNFVLDASALLAHVQEEPGWQVVEKHLNGSRMSTVNYSEVLKKTIEKGGSPAVDTALVHRSRIMLVDFDDTQAALAADLWHSGKALGLSFADRVCLALGISSQSTVLTADRRMAEADVATKVVLLRESHG